MKESLQFRGTHGWRLSVFNFTRSHVWSRTRRWVVTARCLWWGRSVSLCVFLAIVCHLWSAGGIKTHNTHSVIEEWERQGPPQKRKRHCVVFIWFMWVTQYRPLNCTPLGLTRIEKSIYLHTHTHEWNADVYVTQPRNSKTDTHTPSPISQTKACFDGAEAQTHIVGTDGTQQRPEHTHRWPRLHNDKREDDRSIQDTD